MMGLLKKFRIKQKTIHTFDNGIKVYESHLTALQKERYEEINLHEPEEEKLFIDIINGIKENGIFVDIGAAIGYYSFLTKFLRQ